MVSILWSPRGRLEDEKQSHNFKKFTYQTLCMLFNLKISRQYLIHNNYNMDTLYTVGEDNKNKEKS